MDALELRGWLSIARAPVDWLRLEPDGGMTIGTRTYVPGATISDVVDGTRVRKAEGAGAALWLYGSRGAAVLRFHNGGWQRYPLPPELDPFPYTSVNPLPPAEPSPTVPPSPLPVPVPAPPLPAAEPAPAASRFAPFAFLVSVWVALLLVATVAVVSLSGVGAGLEVPPANPAVAWDARCVAHAGWVPARGELAVWLVGLALFGVLVQRNVGAGYALTVAAAGAVCGLLGYELFNTPEGRAAVDDAVARAFWEILMQRGPEAANTFADGAERVVRACQWPGGVSGPAGVVAALIAYAVVRRRFAGSDDVTVRPVKFLVAVAFLAAVLGYAWPNWAAGPFPWAQFVGGFAGGIAVIFPEKVFRWVREKVKEKVDEWWQQARG
jgi:hypothetical protein